MFPVTRPTPVLLFRQNYFGGVAPSAVIKRTITVAFWRNFEQARGVMEGVCIECWLDLRFVVQQTLLRVSESTTFRELFRKEVASKVINGDATRSR